jgi:hypothetical protein
MSGKGRDGSLDCLFSGEGRLLNVKFFRGTDDLIDKDRFRAEFCASVERRKAQMANGGPSPWPKCKKGPVDLRKLVADMP